MAINGYDTCVAIFGNVHGHAPADAVMWPENAHRTLAGQTKATLASASSANDGQPPDWRRELAGLPTVAHAVVGKHERRLVGRPGIEPGTP